MVGKQYVLIRCIADISREHNLSLSRNLTRSLATADIPRDADDVKQTFRVTEGHSLCQSTRHISTVLQISRLAFMHSLLHISSGLNWKKTAGSR